MKVTIIQSDILWQDVTANLANYDAQLQQLEASDLLVFPEMFATGFAVDCQAMAENCNERSMNWLNAKAKQHQAIVVASAPIRENKKLWNRLLVYYPDGHYDSYDKRHLFDYGGEGRYFTAGSKSLIFSCGDFNIKPLICYDLRFPIWSRNVVRNGHYDYDILLYIANWPASRMDQFKQLLIARAIENQSYCIGVNRVGTDGKGLTYSGESLIINPKGEIELSMPSFKQAIVTHQIEIKFLKSYRETFPFLESGDQFNINI